MTEKVFDTLREMQESVSKAVSIVEKEITRNEKIMKRTDSRERKSYDELMIRLEEVETLNKNQTKLMDSFMRIIADAIDTKSSHTGKHCLRVPILSKMIVEKIIQEKDGYFKDIHYSEDELKEIEVASWLHDCGKITTPDHIIDKSVKLENINNRIHEIRTRFEVIHRDLTIEALNKKLSKIDSDEVDTWLKDEHAKLIKDFKFVAKTNLGSEYTPSKDIDKIKDIAKKTWIRNFDNLLGLGYEEEKRILLEKTQTPSVENILSDRPRDITKRDKFDYEEYEKMGFVTEVPENLYNDGEITNLCIPFGTISNEERFKINEHVINTVKMLDKLPFPNRLKNVPLYAGAHHEKLDGKGYPKGLAGKDIPLPSRILALVDVFEALSSTDRPYKTSKKLSVIIDIMNTMTNKNHLDCEVFKLFLNSGVYKEYANKYMKTSQIDKVDLTKYLNIKGNIK